MIDRRGRILLTNVYSLQNIGELSQVKALVNELPEYQFVLVSLYTYGVGDIRNYPDVEVVGNRHEHSRLGVVLTSARLVAEAVTCRLAGRAPQHPILRAYSDPRAVLVVDLSGDTFSDSASPAYTLIHSVSLILAVIMRKPYVVCSQSVGPFTTAVTKRLAKFLLNRAEVITVRGLGQWDYLKRGLKVDTPVFPVTDLACLLEAPNHDFIRRCKTVEGTRRYRGKPHVVVNPSRIINQWMYPRLKAVRHKEESYEELMAKVVDFVSTFGSVMMVPHTTGPRRGLGTVTNPDDRLAIEGIMAKRAPGMGDWEVYLGEDASTITSLIAEADMFVGCRYHSCVEAVMAGVPTLALVYSDKGVELGAMVDNPRLLETVDVRGKTQEHLLFEISETISRMRSRLPEGVVDMTASDSLAEVMRLNARVSIGAIRDAISNQHRHLLGKYQACYLGKSRAYSTRRRRGASGGVATELLLQALDDSLADWVVVSGGDHLFPWPVATKEREFIEDSAGSIYTQNISTPAYIADLCRNGGHCAVVGLPCQIRALRALEEKDPELKEKVALHVGLFCSHAVEKDGMLLLLKAMGVTNLDEIESVRYRAKAPVTGRTGLQVKTRDREYFISLSRYWSRYFNFFYIPQKCWQCRDLANEEADISLGDAWRLEEHSNVIIPRTEIGGLVLANAVRSRRIEMTPVPSAMVVNGQRFFLSLKKNGATPMTATYRAVRRVGHEMTSRGYLRPLVELWVKRVVLK